MFYTRFTILHPRFVIRYTGRMAWSVSLRIFRGIPATVLLAMITTSVFAATLPAGKKGHVKKPQAKRVPIRKPQRLQVNPVLTKIRNSSASKIRITTTTIREAQQRLSDLGYWIGAVSGKW